MVEVGDLIKVNIRRYRDSDDKGIGITQTGKLVLVNKMNGESTNVTAKVTKVLRETIIATRIYEDVSQRPVIDDTANPKSIQETYGYDDEDDTIDTDDDIEDYDDEEDK